MENREQVKEVYQRLWKLNGISKRGGSPQTALDEMYITCRKIKDDGTLVTPEFIEQQYRAYLRWRADQNLINDPSGMKFQGKNQPLEEWLETEQWRSNYKSAEETKDEAEEFIFKPNDDI